MTHEKFVAFGISLVAWMVGAMLFVSAIKEVWAPLLGIAHEHHAFYAAASLALLIFWVDYCMRPARKQ